MGTRSIANVVCKALSPSYNSGVGFEQRTQADVPALMRLVAATEAAPFDAAATLRGDLLTSAFVRALGEAAEWPLRDFGCMNATGIDIERCGRRSSRPQQLQLDWRSSTPSFHLGRISAPSSMPAGLRLLSAFCDPQADRAAAEQRLEAHGIPQLT